MRRAQREGNRIEAIRDSGRALKQLNRKAHHWAKKSGYKKVSVNKLSTSCKKKGALYHCTVAAKVCGR